MQLTQQHQLLQQYMEAKQATNRRIEQNEKIWQSLAGETQAGKSAWLMNSLLNKHADAMDNYPQAVVLPRMESDKAQAEALSKLLPVLLRQNRYEEIYSRLWWEKLKHGTAVQAVLWDTSANQGLGDIIIKSIDATHLYFEPNIEHIEQSRAVFYLSYMPVEDFQNAYPTFSVPRAQFLPPVENKVEMVDCYYKVKKGKQTQLHYCKSCGEHVLYHSENDPLLAQRGLYKHGRYPFVIDSMYHMKYNLFGFGLLDIMKHNQQYIDELHKTILEHSKLAGQKRFFVRVDGGINEQEFADWDKNFIHVAGNIDQNSIREFNLQPLDNTCFAMLGAKIEELKETSGNRDFNQGSVSGGITAASAIAALQEAGNKLSRDLIKSSYRAFVDLCSLMIELVREFYEGNRVFRILDSAEFFHFSNAAMQLVQSDTEYRLPEYDIVIQAQKASPFSTVAQNELAKEFYRLGFFAPQNAAQAIACISMMHFDGKEEVLQNLKNNLEQQYAHTMETPN
ncbi:MAG: hypothetical protein SPL05_06900 [Eubacteriales bacterium]|nr:hypothetical protein [Eubacteriales bacterium]